MPKLSDSDIDGLVFELNRLKLMASRVTIYAAQCTRYSHGEDWAKAINCQTKGDVATNNGCGPCTLVSLIRKFGETEIVYDGAAHRSKGFLLSWPMTILIALACVSTIFAAGCFDSVFLGLFCLAAAMGGWVVNAISSRIFK